MKIKLILLFVSVACIYGNAQNESKNPKVGQSFENFTFKNLDGFSKSEASLKDFKGKWLILDFWGVTCSSCIASFPKINELQEKFKNDVKFVLVGATGKKYWGQNIRKTYERLKTRYNLELTAAFDTTLFEKYQIRTVPRVFIIDGRGVLRADILGTELTESKIQGLMSGAEQVQHTSNSREKPKYNYKENDSIIGRSLLTRFDPKKFSPWIYVDMRAGFEAYKKNRQFNLSGISLKGLYMYAFIGTENILPENEKYGKIFPEPIVELKDSTNFKIDFTGGIGFYSYSHISTIPRSSKEVLMRTVQRDLYNFFGYDVSLENRELPCLNLVRIGNTERLKTKEVGNKEVFEYHGHDGFEYRNLDLDTMAHFLGSALLKYVPIFNETNIDYRVDINLVAILDSLDEVRKALNEVGLDLRYSKRKMKALVIKDGRF